MIEIYNNHAKIPESEDFWKTNTLKVVTEQELEGFQPNFFTHYFTTKISRRCKVEWVYQVNERVVYICPSGYTALKERHYPLPKITPEEQLKVQKYIRKLERDKELEKYFSKIREDKKEQEQIIREEIYKREHTPLGTFQYKNPHNPAYQKKRSFFS